MKTVERIIGFKTGTAASGVQFLKTALERRFASSPNCGICAGQL